MAQSLAPELQAALDRIGEQKFAAEEQLVSELLETYRTRLNGPAEISAQAEQMVIAVRARRAEQPLIDSFMQEFGLSNEEGIALMCLAEALLRVPDADTADDLIADKLLSADWSDHIGQAESVFVNASTWALMLTGRVVALDPQLTSNPSGWFGSLVNRAGAPVIRAAMTNAMRILGREFVLGRTMDEAVKRGTNEFGPKAIFSFDMLGEGARDAASAERYYDAYAAAIDHVAAENQKNSVTGLPEVRSSISIKLSALHPRYEYAQRLRVETELGARLQSLVTRAASKDVAVTIDAEEADRLELSLYLFQQSLQHPRLADWNGLGLAVQAYGKRAQHVISWLNKVAVENKRAVPVRLVKGAYWDTEIKHAQELGLPDFPVFTRKASTDISYIVCASELLTASNLYPQFATHNAHTISAVMSLAGSNRDFEFQRLYGMGRLLYQEARKTFEDFPRTRIYAPVGGHKDLLAYLVRRLLENGANSSFVNRFMDLNVPAGRVVRDPVENLSSRRSIRHPEIRTPKALYGNDRTNAGGVDLTSFVTTPSFLNEVSEHKSAQMTCCPIVSGVDLQGPAHSIANPANRDESVGTVVWANDDHIATAFDAAGRAHTSWDNTKGKARSDILEQVALHLEARMPEFVGILIREAGKCIPDAVAEVREAIDFCRYYAAQARKHFEKPQQLPGPTGETNELSLHGRGVFVCISPWNFPLAIFVGQVAAALAAGNSVIAKPSEKTPLVASKAIRLFLDCGVPPDVIHLLPGNGELGAKMVAHELVAGVAFTGSTAAAQSINRSLAAKEGPIVPLIAETGGQNVMIVDSTALLEQVCDDVLRSAFNSAGQRCSALRVLYLHKGIADNAITLLCGAMNELRVGDPAMLETDVGPIIDEVAMQDLRSHVQSMTKAARFVHEAPLSSETARGSFMAPHLIEISSIRELNKENFGPILHVIRYDGEEVSTMINDIRNTGYGLTFGVHSRIEGFSRDVASRLRVGNSYVNRDMVGAVVGVQPFGGAGLSGTGPKAGGPHYLSRFATERCLTTNSMASGGNAHLLRLRS